jgi:deoxycytidine triphosphate deaminase
MSVLTKCDIEKAIEDGEIICEPSGKINPNSIDVSLSNEFFYQTDIDMPCFPNERNVPDGNFWTRGDLTLFNDKEYIVIQPGETILAITEQFIGTKSKYTTMLKSKSTSGRYCLDVCGSAGWGDPGYVGKWAFPLRNNGKRTIYLRPGTWIAQIVFIAVSTPDDSYLKVGSYNQDFANWDPNSVIPGLMKTR